ncbi:MAG: GNAT family N-acetyltransferase [Thermomicrobiales bacterium]
MSEIAIRQLTPDDWERFRDIRLAALLDAPSAFGSTYAQTVIYTEHIWRSRLTTATMFAAEESGHLLGIAGGLPTQTDNTAALISMWVDPAGRSRGIGEMLVKRVIQWARDERFLGLKLWVTVGNDSAERLYIRCGFVPTGEVQPVDEGSEHSEMSMELTLD